LSKAQFALLYCFILKKKGATTFLVSFLPWFCMLTYLLSFSNIPHFFPGIKRKFSACLPHRPWPDFSNFVFGKELTYTFQFVLFHSFKLPAFYEKYQD